MNTPALTLAFNAGDPAITLPADIVKTDLTLPEIGALFVLATTIAYPNLVSDETGGLRDAQIKPCADALLKRGVVKSRVKKNGKSATVSFTIDIYKAMPKKQRGKKPAPMPRCFVVEDDLFGSKPNPIIRVKELIRGNSGTTVKVHKEYKYKAGGAHSRAAAITRAEKFLAEIPEPKRVQI